MILENLTAEHDRLIELAKSYYQHTEKTGTVHFEETDALWRIACSDFYLR
jgi:hypothetical protein